jgi:hypothetical protein
MSSGLIHYTQWDTTATKITKIMGFFDIMCLLMPCSKDHDSSYGMKNDTKSLGFCFEFQCFIWHSVNLRWSFLYNIYCLACKDAAHFSFLAYVTWFIIKTELVIKRLGRLHLIILYNVIFRICRL